LQKLLVDEMVLCLVALVVFSFLSIFSAKYRRLARDAFDCVFRMITLRPCKVKLQEKIKLKLTSKFMKTPRIARIFYKHFKILSWIFTIAFFASLIYSGYSIYNLLLYGSCDPSSDVCVLTFIGVCMLEIQNILAYLIIIILIITLLYLFVKKRNNSL
jgi:hypothetical protein